MSKLAPVVLFVYNRLEHTTKTIESLSKNLLASQSVLYIFSDAPKSDNVANDVAQVREYISTLSSKGYFKDIIIKEADTNMGLADSIIGGVTNVMQKYGRAIVLEDDLLCAPDFLDFMNQSLDFYKDNPMIGSISGYSPLKALPQHYSKDIWIASRTSSLGWATWIDRWQEVKWDIDDFETFKRDKKARKRFDECGSDRYDRLRRQLEIGANSWSIRFGYWQFRAGKYTIFPSYTRIQHIGWDGSGVHGIYNGPLDTHISNKSIPFNLESNIQPDKEVIKTLKYIYSGSVPSRISRYLRNNGFEKLEKFLRNIIKKGR